MKAIRTPLCPVLGHPIWHIEERNDLYHVVGEGYEVVDPQDGRVIGLYRSLDEATQAVLSRELRVGSPRHEHRAA